MTIKSTSTAVAVAIADTNLTEWFLNLKIERPNNSIGLQSAYTLCVAVVIMSIPARQSLICCYAPIHSSLHHGSKISRANPYYVSAISSFKLFKAFLRIQKSLGNLWFSHSFLIYCLRDLCGANHARICAHC